VKLALQRAREPQKTRRIGVSKGTARSLGGGKWGKGWIRAVHCDARVGLETLLEL
jgi:hypothetical protein